MNTDTVSVVPFEIKAKHYGSAYAMTDYTSKSHYLYFTTGFTPTPRIRTFGTVSLTNSEAALEQVIMPDVTSRLAGDLGHQDFTFPEMHTYSDLKYQLVKLSLGVSVKVSPRVTWTASGDFADLKDDAPYVYGDETGSLTVVRTGIQIDF